MQKKRAATCSNKIFTCREAENTAVNHLAKNIYF